MNLDQLLGYGDQLTNMYAKAKLAEKGVAPIPVMPSASYEAPNGGPLVQQGQAAAVIANAVDKYGEVAKDVAGKAAFAYSAKQFSDSIPYVVGGLAFATAIYLLVRDKK